MLKQRQQNNDLHHSRIYVFAYTTCLDKDLNSTQAHGAVFIHLKRSSQNNKIDHLKVRGKKTNIFSKSQEQPQLPGSKLLLKKILKIEI